MNGFWFVCSCGRLLCTTSSGGLKVVALTHYPPPPLRVKLDLNAVLRSGLEMGSACVLKCLKMSNSVFFCPAHVGFSNALGLSEPNSRRVVPL
jgi:hypothetical protein